MLERTSRLPPAPRAERHPRSSTWHGITLTDDYAWLRAENWREVMRDPSKLEPKIGAYLAQENDYTKAALGHTEALQQTLFTEMKGRIKEDDSTVPSPDGPLAYYIRYREGGQHPVVCRQPREGGTEQVMLDGDALAVGKPFFQLGGMAHSPDHRLLAWSADDKGSEIDTLRVRDLGSGEDLPDILPEVSGSPVWIDDSSAFYYVRLDDNHRPSRIYRHRLGTAAGEDVLVYEEQDSRFFVSLGRAQSGRFADISVHDHETSETWLIDLTDPDAAPRLVAARETSVQYDVEHHPDWDGEDVLVVRTNAGGAEDFKIAVTPLARTQRENWRDLIPHRRGVYLLSVTLFAEWLIRLEREDSLPRIVVRHLASGEEHAIAFAEEAYSLGADGGYEFATGQLRFHYSSMTTPNEVWDYDLKTRARTLRKRQEVPSGHDPAAYVTHRLRATAPDGETVPISILHRRDVKPDGSAPLLLYGYGSYGYAMPASFATGRLSLVDRGFVYAIAHIRGGTEKGWHWYQDGKLLKKPNTFTDFIAAAEFLRAQGYAAPGRIVAHGGSAGGLLMGAVANMRPDLFGGIVAEVPFVDVINTMLDDSLPLTPPEWQEWGNPIEDARAFRTMLGYSPYDNVRAQNYPAILALAGLTDPRVTYWEPAKWVAKLRSLNTSGSLIALRTNMDAGHGGAAGRFDRLKEVALSYAFAIDLVGAPQTV
ncbi:MAG: S9 family peptidase [Alphaproteobacteria bacterium]|nr:MAG: S9 family peptidase [Alphaproteobacteria bacterium]